MQKPKLGKIKLLSAKEQVAAVLRKAILSRDLVEGQEITLKGLPDWLAFPACRYAKRFKF